MPPDRAADPLDVLRVVGDCCEAYPSRRVIQASRDALRAALTHAVTEEEISKNVASLVKVPTPRRRRIKPWSVAEAGQFLADAAARDDHLFAAWMLVLCLGLRRGEVLGLTWKSVDFERGELYVDHQIQRAGRQILHRETKTEDSDDFLPLPVLCLKALWMRRAQQSGNRKAIGDAWQDDRGLIFTTKYGTPIEPGNLTRMFALRARRAGLRVIPLRNTRHTCSSLLVALKVHPKVAQRILRHSQIAMTMEVYAEASEEGVRSALDQLSCAMDGSGLPGCCTSLLYGPTQEAPGSSPGASHLCALGRIRTCNLLIRSQMLYPLSYECLFCCCLGFRSGVSRAVAATGRTLHDCRRHVKSVRVTPCELRKRRSPGPGTGAS